MGGRGAASGYVTRLPNYNKAKVFNSKTRDYLLNPHKSNGKSEFFKDLGYTMKNANRLEKDIRNGLKTNKALEHEKDKHGNVAYQVVMQLGIAKKAAVVTGWQVDKGANVPRLVTAYPKKKKGKQ